jgi:hypothetical protein
MLLERMAGLVSAWGAVIHRVSLHQSRPKLPRHLALSRRFVGRRLAIKHAKNDVGR